LPTEFTLANSSWATAVGRARNGREAVSDLNDVLAVRRIKTSTMLWRKIINDVLSVRSYQGPPLFSSFRVPQGSIKD
jgi:hypothetical protein